MCRVSLLASVLITYQNKQDVRVNQGLLVTQFVLGQLQYRSQMICMTAMESHVLPSAWVSCKARVSNSISILVALKVCKTI